MDKKNKNQAYIGNDLYRAAFPIRDLLPEGRENAVTTAELLKLTGCSSARELQERISVERNAGAVICSGAGSGYWRPKNRQEILDFCHTMEARAINTLAATRSAKEALKIPEGQQEIDIWGYK